jgi:nucleoid-associated protein YgaU
MPDHEERRPDFSNVKSGSSSSAVPKSDPVPPMARTYTVKKGDSLSKIAKNTYGDAAKWRAIFDANRDQIENADLIHPGQVLKLPEL